MKKTIASITRIATDILVKSAGFGLVVMTAIVGWQVFGRYVLNESPSWSEQAALTLMIWFVAFAAATGVREGFHIRIVALQRILPKRIQTVMRILSNAVVGVCGIAMLIWGGELVVRTWPHEIPSLGIPRGLAYLGLPIAGTLIGLFACEQILDEWTEEKPRDAEDRRWS